IDNEQLLPPWTASLQKADSHYFGIGEVEDKELALELYERASRLGSPEAEMKLGEMYQNGDGCIADLREARLHFEEAERRGMYRAYINLADIHLKTATDDSVAAQNFTICWQKLFQHSAFKADQANWG